jgi:hypothetical protein
MYNADVWSVRREVGGCQSMRGDMTNCYRKTTGTLIQSIIAFKMWACAVKRAECGRAIVVVAVRGWCCGEVPAFPQGKLTSPNAHMRFPSPRRNRCRLITHARMSGLGARQHRNLSSLLGADTLRTAE